jgi:ribose 5-phosphate isomerase RpiB
MMSGEPTLDKLLAYGERKIIKEGRVIIVKAFLTTAYESL